MYGTIWVGLIPEDATLSFVNWASTVVGPLVDSNRRPAIRAERKRKEFVITKLKPFSL
jgi:hypothetical protein